MRVLKRQMPSASAGNATAGRWATEPVGRVRRNAHPSHSRPVSMAGPEVVQLHGHVRAVRKRPARSSNRQTREKLPHLTPRQPPCPSSLFGVDM